MDGGQVVLAVVTVIGTVVGLAALSWMYVNWKRDRERERAPLGLWGGPAAVRYKIDVQAPSFLVTMPPDTLPPDPWSDEFVRWGWENDAILVGGFLAELTLLNSSPYSIQVESVGAEIAVWDGLPMNCTSFSVKWGGYEVIGYEVDIRLEMAGKRRAVGEIFYSESPGFGSGSTKTRTDGFVIPGNGTAAITVTVHPPRNATATFSMFAECRNHRGEVSTLTIRNPVGKPFVVADRPGEPLSSRWLWGSESDVAPVLGWLKRSS